MRFATPDPAYDDVRGELFGTAEVPWPAPEATADQDSTSPAVAAAVILAHLSDPADTRLRLLVGDDAPGQVAAALEARLEDYRRDPRFPS
jgi:hypothetical protein